MISILDLYNHDIFKIFFRNFVQYPFMIILLLDAKIDIIFHISFSIHVHTKFDGGGGGMGGVVVK